MQKLMPKRVEKTFQGSIGLNSRSLKVPAPQKESRRQSQNIYHSQLVEDIKSENFSKQFGRYTIHLTRSLGFCYGVDRAVALAYEACQKYPKKNIYLTTEIIHNPTVNQNFKDMGIRFLSGPHQSAEINDLTKDDVVIVPAFGTTIRDLNVLHNIGCTLIDTICGSVMVVWKRIEKYARNGFTSVIHGKRDHEEIQATVSQMTQHKNAHYLIIKDLNEAMTVCNYILRKKNKKMFIKKFKSCTSADFDPDKHLEKIGLANQTTMLSKESLEIGELFKVCFKEKYGPKTYKNYLMTFDTICQATQERQDSIVALKQKKPACIIVIGGYNSSNTTQLHKIASSCTQSYHINLVDCIINNKKIRHKPYNKKEEIMTSNWLPDGPVSIGITAGASTPNKVIGDVIERIISFR
ncbi:MAG: 4-hydroxy-3-methylbut-2-enyl diphosphate reductase [Deltaproteobacteria bacterium]|nr:4-hydroxy-3-methylbut-2-enyl diphosphate reductase [Deltaproteobacteria bacterium]